MPFFIMFIFGTVMIGAGAMLSPAWPTTQPRIGTAATFALALVVGGAVFWANLFGWSTLVIDYLLFALVSVVILGGTMAQAQTRAEARGEELLDENVGWPGPEDLAFFAVVTILCALPLAIFAFPVGDHAAANAMITLAAREGGTFDSLAPYFPDITGFVAPGFYALAAYLSAQLQQPIPQIHMAVGAVLALLCVWAAYDLGAEIQHKRLGRAMAVATLLSLGVANLYLNSYYTQLMGTVFTFAFATYAVRVVRHHLLLDVVAAGLMLGAVLYVSPAMFVLMFAAYFVFLLANYLPKRIEKGIPQDTPTPFAHIGRWLGVPLVAFLGTAPWTLTHLAELQQLASHWVVQYQIFGMKSSGQLLAIQGIWILPLIAIGIVVGWRMNRSIMLWCLGWLILAFLLYPPQPTPIQSIAAPLPNPAQPQALAPFLPYAVLGGFGLLWVFEQLPAWLRDLLRQTVYWQLTAFIGIVMIGLVLTLDALLPVDRLTRADMAAMQWLAENTPVDTLILNHPSDVWIVPTSGRRAIYVAIPDGHFAANEPCSDCQLFEEYWREPERDIRFIDTDTIHYLIVPQWTHNPSPSPESVGLALYGGESELRHLPFLELVFEQDGAVVYRVTRDE